MKKTIFFGMMAAALGFTACSDDNSSMINEKPQKGMTLNATVVNNADTRANIDNSNDIWPFTFSAGDKVVVTNFYGSGASYEFTNDVTSFTCIDASPTEEPTTWYAHYPSGDIDLTDQEGTLEYIASIYALSGSTATPTKGDAGLTINLVSSMSIVKLINGGGAFDIRIRKNSDEWVKGMTQTTDGFEVSTSSEPVSIFKTTEAGEYYIAMPAGMEMVINDGDVFLNYTWSLAAGKYYSLTINEAVWSFSIPYGVRSTPTSISIETYASSIKPDGAYDLNAQGDVWGVLDGTTYRIQTPRPKIKVAAGMFPGNCMFQMFSNVTAITGLDNLDTRDVTDMSSMFSYCRSLTSIDLSSFNTEKVKTMYGMFSNCESLTSIDLSSFVTKNVTTMNSMFSGCKSLPSLVVTNFNTENVSDMAYMFGNCESLTSLDVSNFKTDKVTEMNQMFSHCKKIVSLDLSGFNTAEVTTMSAMFQHCYDLTSLNVSNFDTKKVTDMGMMFVYCNKLPQLDLSSFNLYSSPTISYIFSECWKMESLKLSNDFTVNNITQRHEMFAKCGQDVTDSEGISTKGIIYNVTNDAIKDACKYFDGDIYSDLYSGWDVYGTNMKFEGE